MATWELERKSDELILLELQLIDPRISKFAFKGSSLCVETDTDLLDSQKTSLAVYSPFTMERSEKLTVDDLRRAQLKDNG